MKSKCCNAEVKFTKMSLVSYCKKCFKQCEIQDDIPCCEVCGAKMVNAVDTHTGNLSPYLWKTTCSHNKHLVLSKG